jgi:hypothetical protein
MATLVTKRSKLDDITDVYWSHWKVEGMVLLESLLVIVEQTLTLAISDSGLKEKALPAYVELKQLREELADTLDKIDIGLEAIRQNVSVI